MEDRISRRPPRGRGPPGGGLRAEAALTAGSVAASVVIPTRDRRASLARALRALANQTVAGADYEVVVAIDGSEDGTREMVATFAAPFSLRAVETGGRGRAMACNAGARAARGRLLVFLDDDMEPSGAFVREHLAAHPAGSRGGVLGAVPVAIADDAPPVLRFVGGKFNRHLERLASPGFTITFRDFYSGNFSIFRETFLEAGGFDEDFRAYGNEDGELALRLLAAGVGLRYAPSASAEQHYEKDFAALARDEIATGKTAVLCARKAPEALLRLRLGNYRKDGWKWRALRGALLAASRALPRTPERVIRLVEWAERRRPRNLDACYSLALDYLYWFGASSAMDRAERRALTSRSSRTSDAAANRPLLHG